MPGVEIIEVSPRDGLQNQAAILSVDQRVELVRRLAAAGARRIEVASFVNPKLVPQMAEPEAVVAGLHDLRGVTRVGLVLNQRGLERALTTSVEEIGVVAVASDAFGIRNQRQSVADSVEMAKAVIGAARAAGRRAQVTIAVAFGCPFEGHVPMERVAGIARELATASPHELALADTVGVGAPAQVKALLERVSRAAPGLPLRCHFHNTRNTGLANAWAAVEAGVTRLDASAGAIGGCPFAPNASGNIGTEDLVYLLEQSGIDTGHDQDALVALAPWLREALGLTELPAMVSRVDSFPPAA